MLPPAAASARPSWSVCLPFDLLHEFQFFQNPIVRASPPGGGVLSMLKTFVSPAAGVNGAPMVLLSPSGSGVVITNAPGSLLIVDDQPGSTTSQIWYDVPGVRNVVKLSVPPLVELATSVSRIVPVVVVFAPVRNVNVNVSGPGDRVAVERLDHLDLRQLRVLERARRGIAGVHGDPDGILAWVEPCAAPWAKPAPWPVPIAMTAPFAVHWMFVSAHPVSGGSVTYLVPKLATVIPRPERSPSGCAAAVLRVNATSGAPRTV